jgi:hypothetical protein
MDADVRANRAQVRFHAISILDRASSGNRYSTRAANAAYCMSDQNPNGVDLFVAFHNLLFTKAVQPPEDGHGMSNVRLENYAVKAGLPKSQVTTFDDCVQNQSYVPLVQAITDRASRNGISATPTIIINGKSLKTHTLAAFNAAVAQALKHGPKPNPSVTPSPTPTITSSIPPLPTGSVAPSGSAPPTSSSSASKSPSKSASSSKKPSKPSSSKKPSPSGSKHS